MMTKKLFPFAIFSLVLIAAIYLLIQLNRAYEEFSHWKSKEAVLEKELEDLRDKINAIDDEILNLLSSRSEIVLEIGKYKNREFVIDLDREQKILDRLVKKSKAAYSKDTVVRLWREIFQSSEKLQKKITTDISSKRSMRRKQPV